MLENCGFQPIGLLYFTSPQMLPHLEANIAMPQAVGVNTRIIRPDEARELDPSLWLGDMTHIAYEPDSGYADPNRSTLGGSACPSSSTASPTSLDYS